MAAIAPEFVRPGNSQGCRATQALAAYRLVKLVVSGSDIYADYPAAQFAWTFGITRHAATTAGDMVDIVYSGIALLQVDGNAANISIGDRITAHDSTGYGQKSAGGAAASRPCIGIALAASTADGDVIPVLISQHAEYFAA